MVIASKWYDPYGRRGMHRQFDHKYWPKNPYAYTAKKLASAAYRTAASRMAKGALGYAAKSAYSYATTKNTAPSQPLRGKPAKRRVRKPRPSKIKNCSKAIRELQRHDRASLGDMTYRELSAQQILCTPGTQKVHEFSGACTPSSIETVLAQCKYFDPATPGTLVVGSQAAGTYQRNTLIKSISAKLLLRNNYQSDVKVKVYLCHAKDDSNVSPEGAWSNAIADGSNLSALTELQQYPTDYDLFNDLYRSKVVVNTTLAPGQSITTANTEKDIEYNSAVMDTQSLTYQKQNKMFGWLVVISGTTMHNPATGVQSLGAGGVDALTSTTYRVKYDAGINIRYIYCVNDVPVGADTDVQSHQPIPDNITYSAA